MSKSKEKSNRATQAFRRRGQSVSLKPLDFERRFIDDLIEGQASRYQHNNGAIPTDSSRARGKWKELNSCRRYASKKWPNEK
jgi:hypothetical protein